MDLLTIEKGLNAPNMVSDTLIVSKTVTSVGDVPLPENWKWDNNLIKKK